MNSSLSLKLPNCDKASDIECDASSMGIGGVLIQERKPSDCFSLKIKGDLLNYSTYDNKLYALLRVLVS